MAAQQTTRPGAVYEWPWKVDVSAVQAQAVGPDLKRVLDFGVWSSRAELDDMAGMVASGVPAAGRVDVRFEIADDGGCEVSVDQPACKISKKFVKYDGALEVSFGAYWIQNNLTNKGFAKRLFRNLAHAYVNLGVAYVTTFANCEVGGYTWAKMAARPREPELHKSGLKLRVGDLLTQGKLSDEDAADLESRIEGTPPERLMYELACSVNAKGHRLGQTLLLGSGWEAFWDLSDADHCALIAEALQ